MLQSYPREKSRKLKTRDDTQTKLEAQEHPREKGVAQTDQKPIVLGI